MCFKNMRTRNENNGRHGHEKQMADEASKQNKQVSTDEMASIKAANVCVRGHGCCSFVTRIRWVVVAR